MSFPTRSLVFAALLAWLAMPAAWSQEKRQPAPEEETGLAVGAKAPRFALKDQDGKERALDEFLKRGNVALVFYRSADW